MNNNEFRSIQIKPLEYQSTLAKQLFSHIESLPWAMLLRSASESHVDSRYDILVAQPIATFETIGAKTTVNVNETCEVSDSDPFELLDQYQQQLLPATKDHPELPFIGGALGYFSYDLGRRVETLPSLAERDIEAPDMAVGLYEWAIVVDHKLKTACVVGQNIEAHWSWLSEQQDKPHAAEFGLTTPWQSNMSEQSYADKFDSVQEYLLSGDCYQINLAQRFNAQYQGSEWLAYDKLEQYNSAPFSGFIRLADSAIISVSPERFLELKDNVIETKPIKGTRPRSDDHVIDNANAQDLANADKDQAENLMIVDLLRNDIGRVAKPGTVHVPKLFDIESFPAVHHLVSTIRADLDYQYSATDLLRACFPGGSITGAPKVRAMQIIEELEPHRRSAYCGSIGYISRNGRMDTSITIRTLVAENNMLYAWAGGGVVFDSDCASEYQETLDKLSRILPVLEAC
ncbi:aminodeoxychorismate synthase component I [Vibrio sp. 10N.261.46.E12]|uniref:aminodeoxychorismate synthase component I n=1 Tax=unclassified Vibrio TaxID=2614977 RepID=UPI00097793A2|nr:MULTISPECIES: aminodeoxychorismate synthase component I [unclassified Vibrio]OMO36595.1 aminodeoxychorismate synthase, component I [Vibrio sp. 10N.261.45.E1]PMJ26417.1 aminodeoxychorismate synthase, component I [Vibrio sp. 10N.286.45.B6]PML90223.1 aminodeoxychorismate synthase, component I [Vibrio sp. 10N.261.49.E11]PMM67958.1 aminodeoxychorismate synthase, component I [Vibrio sp. 10N.261.46.F12]PMM80104.1 aminodeoxychorismate synthase, component I [Vibrio sp. 10N.261.46.E8]